jgi:hypothetical protein
MNLRETALDLGFDEIALLHLREVRQRPGGAELVKVIERGREKAAEKVTASSRQCDNDNVIRHAARLSVYDDLLTLLNQATTTTT